MQQRLLAYWTAAHDDRSFSHIAAAWPFNLIIGRYLLSPCSYRGSQYEEYTRALRERLFMAYRLAADNIQTAQQHQKFYYDRYKTRPKYHDDVSVLQFSPRPLLGTAANFHHPWQCPGTIIYQPFRDSLVLRDLERPFDDLLTVHYDQLKLALG